jgi:hypothetical protein
MEYYILTGFLTLMLGPFVGFIPPVLFLLYYPITKLVFKALKKDTKKLDDFYLAIPRFFNFTTITNFIINWIIMPPINFVSWLPEAILSIVKFQTKVIEFLLVTVPKRTFKVIEFLIDNLVIGSYQVLYKLFYKIHRLDSQWKRCRLLYGSHHILVRTLFFPNSTTFQSCYH